MPSSAVRAFSEPDAYFCGDRNRRSKLGLPSDVARLAKVEDRATIRNFGAGAVRPLSLISSVCVSQSAREQCGL